MQCEALRETQREMARRQCVLEELLSRRGLVAEKDLEVVEDVEGAATLWLGADNDEQHAGGHTSGNWKGGDNAEDREEEGELNFQVQLTIGRIGRIDWDWKQG
jgi:hypothetical protein